MSRFIFISIDSDGRVNLREHKTEKNLGNNFILHEEFELALQKWHLAGHKVEMDEWTGEPLETLVQAIQVRKGMYTVWDTGTGRRYGDPRND